MDRLTVELPDGQSPTGRNALPYLHVAARPPWRRPCRAYLLALLSQRRLAEAERVRQTVLACGFLVQPEDDGPAQAPGLHPGSRATTDRNRTFLPGNVIATELCYF